MKVLLLGGTAILGHTIATAALKRGHEVTCLARGNGEVPHGLTFVRADRDRDDALGVVSGEVWDVVIDLTRQPVHARRVVRDLDAQHWIFVSSTSVYSRGDVLEQDESAPLVDALDGDYFTDPAQYGPAKVACENFYRGHSASHTIVRPALIGGDGDDTGRSGYYPWRFAHPTGENVVVPDPTHPIALIDVRDLAEWIVECAEQRHCGIFNAAGETMTLADVLDLSREITASTAVPWVLSNEALADFDVAAWMGPRSLPLWVNDPSYRYVATFNSAAARERGLVLSPLRETLVAALRYEERRQEPRLAGLSDEEEREIRRKLSGG